jgi:hypothetical protein
MTFLATHWHVAIPGVVIVAAAWGGWKLCGCTFWKDDDR